MAITVVDHGEFAFADGSTANGATGHDVSLPGGGSAQAGDFDVLFVGSDTTVTTPGGGTLFDLYSTFVGNQGGYAFVRRCAAATIAKDTTGFTAITVSATSATVDITAAKVGTVVYAWVALGINSGTVSSTGWAPIANADEGTACHYALLWRRKQPGDTLFSFGWTTSTKGVIGWTSYFGLDPTTPHEAGTATLVTNGVTSRTAVPTSSQTPAAANRWALACYGVRTTNVANKPISWTADAALVERLDVDNSASGTSPWLGIQMADSNGAVTAAAHSYTATHAPANESHDASMIVYLIPAAAEGPTVRIKTAVDSDTIALWSRVRGADSPDVAVNAHVDNSGNTASPGLNTGALAAVNEAIFVASTNTDMQAGTPTGPSWAGGYNALGTATSGSGATGVWGTHAWLTPVGTAAETPSVSWTNGMRNRYIFAVTFTALPAPVTITDVSGGAGAGGSTEALAVGVTIADPSGGGGAGGSTETLSIGVTIADPSGGGGAGGSTDTLAAGISLLDQSGGAGAGGSSDTVSVGKVIADVSGGAGAGGSTDLVTNNVTILDVSGGAGAGSSADVLTGADTGVVQDTMVMPVLANALTCLNTEVGKVPKPPAEYMIRPGATFTAMADFVYDECCAGIAWVRPGPMYETDNFPQQRAGASKIDPADYAVTIELGVMRCLPTQSDQSLVQGQGARPTTAQWLAATQAEMDDAAALRRVICCLRDIYGDDALVAGNITPLENEANCAGVSVVVTMRVPACDCVG